MTLRCARVLRPRSGIYVVNASTLAADAEVAAWTAACATQLRRDVAPAYGRRPVRVQFLSAADHAPAGAWVIVVLDDADQAGALGYHSVDGRGRVYGRVFVRPCLDYEVPPSTTLSHEVIETFADPGVDRWVDTGHGWSVPYEVCDAVEAGQYEIDGVPVSDFVHPRWFDRTARSGRFSHLRAIGAPFMLAAGGYVVRRFPDGREDQQFGATANKGYVAAKASALSRTTRRSATAAAPSAEGCS